MHVITHLSEKYQKMQTPENGWYTYEAGMAHLEEQGFFLRNIGLPEQFMSQDLHSD